MSHPTSQNGNQAKGVSGCQPTAWLQAARPDHLGRRASLPKPDLDGQTKDGKEVGQLICTIPVGRTKRGGRFRVLFSGSARFLISFGGSGCP